MNNWKLTSIRNTSYLITLQTSIKVELD